ncbi:MAG: hypothetical protein LQ348_000446 [Seirophora lacunosa]|nr:MAG: hypothetical protein LQ348_000446 [Seirophora lacunosa]
MQEESEVALQSRWPDCKDWTAVYPYMILAQAIAQVTTRVLCGQELARNEEWIKLSVETTISAMQTAAAIREKYPPYLRWLAPYFMPGPQLSLTNRKRAAEILRPVLLKRRAGKGDGSGYSDGIQWLIAAAGARGKSVEELADEQLFLSIASVHSTSASLLSIVQDLASSGQYREEILDEMRSVQQERGTTWTKASLAKLNKLDSFMKESQRVNPIGLGKASQACLWNLSTPILRLSTVTVTRAAVKPYTFKDGFHLPANTLISFSMAELNRDPDVWPDSETFDGSRFLRMRQKGDANAWQFAFVGENSINFGAGTHACPGRYYVSQEIKIMLAHLLLHFDFKWPDGKSRPANMVHDFATPPSPMAELMFRRKESPGSSCK